MIWSLQASVWLSTCGGKNKELCNRYHEMHLKPHMCRQESLAGCSLTSDTHGPSRDQDCQLRLRSFKRKSWRQEKSNNLLTISLNFFLKSRSRDQSTRGNISLRNHKNSSTVGLPSTRKLKAVYDYEITYNFSTWNLG